MRTSYAIVLLCLALQANVFARSPLDGDEFALCDKSRLYRVDDAMLASKGYDALPLVTVPPNTRGTPEELQRFFDEKVVLGPRAADVFVRVHIGFTVNCHGRIGDVRILSPAEPEIAKAIASAIEQLPTWDPGTVAGTPVDTVTKLVFTVAQGKAKVSVKK